MHASVLSVPDELFALLAFVSAELSGRGERHMAAHWARAGSVVFRSEEARFWRDLCEAVRRSVQEGGPEERGGCIHGVGLTARPAQRARM